MSTDSKCSVCLNETKRTYSGEKMEVVHINCERCGKFSYMEVDVGLELERGIDSSTQPIEDSNSRKRANISSWIRENQGIHITAQDLDYLRNLKSPSFSEKANKLLLAIQSETQYASQKIGVRFKKWLALGWAVNYVELQEIFFYLRSRGLIGIERMKQGGSIATSISIRDEGALVRIEPAGWERLEQLVQFNPTSSQGFVAMSFDPLLKPVYQHGHHVAIEDSGYSSKRIDNKEHNNKICDEIIAEIRKSRFLVADFTGQKGGVYFEAGFGMGFGIPIIWACKKDEIDKLHFDIRQYNCIDWADTEDLKSRLQNRIEATLGKGPLKPHASRG